MIFSPHLNTSYSRCGLLLRTERRGLSDTTVNSSKAAEPIVMPFGMWTTPQRERAILWAKRTSAGHARACLAVDILKSTQQGAEPARCIYRLACTRCGTYWRHLANTTEHNSETITDREKRRPPRPMKSSELSNGENRIAR